MLSLIVAIPVVCYVLAMLFYVVARVLLGGLYYIPIGCEDVSSWLLCYPNWVLWSCWLVAMVSLVVARLLTSGCMGGCYGTAMHFIFSFEQTNYVSIPFTITLYVLLYLLLFVFGIISKIRVVFTCA